MNIVGSLQFFLLKAGTRVHFVMLKILICKLCGLILTNVIEIKNTKMNIEIIYFVYILNVTLVELFYIFVVLITLIYI